MSTADRLYARLFGDWKTIKRASKMSGRCDQARKYTDIPDYGFSRALLVEHLDGRSTYAATLGLLGQARAGAKDYDAADEAEILAALAAAADRGIVAAAFLVGGRAGEH
jgi:hypothetical protein